jgi:hypothetical protein
MDTALSALAIDVPSGSLSVVVVLLLALEPR